MQGVGDKLLGAGMQELFILFTNFSVKLQLLKIAYKLKTWKCYIFTLKLHLVKCRIESHNSLQSFFFFFWLCKSSCLLCRRSSLKPLHQPKGLFDLNDTLFFFQPYSGLDSGLTSWTTSTAFFCDGFFKIGSHELFAGDGFKPWCSWSLPPE
jgi:hypothetical protein